MSTAALPPGISAIDTHYLRPQQDASHLINTGGRAAFVDTGVNDSVPGLLAALAAQDLDPGDVDFVFLTHVHLDHAGGAGLLMQALPNASCVIHPRGARHMIDPTRLQAGTEAVYGKAKTAQLYGELIPIPSTRVVEAADGDWFELNGRALQTRHTEGHARHHYVLNDPASRGVFTGDSFGVSYRELDTPAGPVVFPTTTPIQFDPAAAHASVDTIVALEPERLFLTHYSQVQGIERLAAQMHSGLDAYVDAAREHAASDQRTTRIESALFEYMAATLGSEGFEGDTDTVREVLGVDIELNTQGLEHWLENAA